MKKIVTRIAPSPTGYLHFGLARTALFNYLYAKKHGGEFVVRIEDTDKERNKPEYEQDIIDQLDWLGLKADRAYRQSDHLKRHRKLLLQLIDSDAAYVSKEPAKDDPSRTVEVVRLRNPNTTITFHDLIRGDISFNTTDLGDFVLARSIDEPLYHFAVVVDDHDEEVTHVIRGEEHISNTPRQILIHRALGFELPSYAHLPLILMPDKSKMSKRKHQTSVKSYREMGFLRDALINFTALLGWTPKSQKEILSVDEMVAEFELEELHKGGAIFNIEKLRWFNREYLHRMSPEEFQKEALAIFKEALSARGLECVDSICEKLLPVLKEKIHTWQDVRNLVGEGEFDYFFYDPAPFGVDIPQKGSTGEVALRHIKHIIDALESAPDDTFSDHEKIKATLWDYATAEGRGDVLWPMRFSLSGRPKSPDPFTIAAVIGKEATLRRLNTAIKALEMS